MAPGKHSESNLSQVNKILLIVLALNLLTATVKAWWGYWTHSISMQADGFHSFLDAASNVVGLIGVWVASHPPDDTHPYGHRKFETFGSFCISVFLFFGCFEILKNSYDRFQSAVIPEITPASFVIMFTTVIVNLMLSRWESRKGMLLKSEVLIADSFHTRSDVFASISVIASLAGSWAGYSFIDPLVGVIIAAIIGKVGGQILMESSKVLTDYSRIHPSEIHELVMKIHGVEECHAVRTRGSMSHVYVDLHIHVAPQMPLEKAHILAHRVEAEIMKKFSDVLEVVVHLEPHIPQLEND
ncbi:MAG TPA: cation diffusion facilitator family transporter [Candidatus Manganitrophaceae bacterium]|nr:cation diffusion facilitator family transporter [Candidatus Manganitrophaceae bacterium]